MEPILTKQEIKDLLTAVKEGRISTDIVDDGRDLSKYFKPAEEVDLFQIYKIVASSGLKIPNLDIVLDDFAKSSSISTTNLLQRTFTVTRLTDMIGTTFQDALADLNNEGCLAIYSLDPLRYGCLIHLDSELAFTILEIMLGASGLTESVKMNRSFTAIEKNVFKNVMVGSCQDLARAFEQIHPLTPKLVKIESNFRLAKIVEDTMDVTVAKFKVHLAGKSRDMRLIIPTETLEPLREKFKEIVTISSPIIDWTETLHDEILNMDTELIARSGVIRMSIREILRLKTGDFVPLDYDLDQPLTIMIEDQPKFFAVPGKRNNKKAVHVKGRYGSRTGAMHGYAGTKEYRAVT